MKTPEQLASVLTDLAESYSTSGKLAWDIRAAARLILMQKAELDIAAGILATKHHTVKVTAFPAVFHTDMKVELIATKPRRYVVVHRADNYKMRENDFIRHESLWMARHATQKMMAEIEKKCEVSLREALRKLPPESLQNASRTGKTGKVDKRKAHPINAR